MKSYRNIHIGALIQQKVKEKMRVKQFAAMMHCSRTNVYQIFNSKTADTDKLVVISSLLEHNFFKEFYAKNSSAKNAAPAAE